MVAVAIHGINVARNSLKENMAGQEFKYSYHIDLDSDSTATKVLGLVGRDKKVLELGCGPGHMSNVMVNELGCLVKAVEIDEQAAQRARRYCQDVKVCNLDETDLKSIFDKDCFDVIVMADVLEHLREPEKTLIQAKSLLSPSGKVVISMPNVAHAGVISALLCCRFPYGDIGLLDRTHLRFFTASGLIRLLKKAGYRINTWLTSEVAVEYTEFKPFFEALPGMIQDFLLKTPNAKVYQFVVDARLKAKGNMPDGDDETDLSDKIHRQILMDLKERDKWIEKSYLNASNTFFTDTSDEKSFVRKIVSFFKNEK